MRPESAVKADGVDDEAPKRTWRRVLLALSVMLLIVLIGAVPIFVLLGGPTSKFGRSIGFGAAGPTVIVRAGAIGPIDLQRSQALVDADVVVTIVGFSSSSRGSLMGHTETRGFTVRVTPNKEPLEREDLTYRLLDDKDKVIGEGTLKLPAKLDVGETADAEGGRDSSG